MRNGKTVEIHNTDAEGRLILADGLSLGAESKPDAMIDIATLTGACLAALGKRMAGVLGNNTGVIDQLKASSARTDELLWELPLFTDYRRMLIRMLQTCATLVDHLQVQQLLHCSSVSLLALRHGLTLTLLAQWMLTVTAVG
jgi:leucyl aminopeptidase